MNLAVFASGSGSNFQAIAQAIAAGKLTARLCVVISNVGTAGIHERAKQCGIPSFSLNPRDFTEEAIYVQQLMNILQQYHVDFIALAGYLRKIPTPLLSAFPNRILNIHPSLLPAFGGKGMYGHRVHEAVLAHGVRWTGATVHLVDSEYDTGPIVLQEPVPVRQDDTPETLAARVLFKEHRIFPEALQLFAEQRVHITEQRTVIIDGLLPRGYHRSKLCPKP